VFEYISGVESVTIQEDTHIGPGEVASNDSGKSWSYTDKQRLFYRVYGTATVPGPAQTATRRYVKGIRVNLRAASLASAVLSGAAQAVNSPELLSGRWDARFDTDPTLDHNGDGRADWVVRGGGSFKTVTLSGGVWYADATIDTYPDNNFTELTTVDVRYRSTSVGGGALFSINADWAGGLYAPLMASVVLGADGKQTLTVSDMRGGMTIETLLKVPGLSSDFVDLRLIVDPVVDTVSVTVNGVHEGTFGYNSITPSVDVRYASLVPSAGAEFDDVSVHVGGDRGVVANTAPTAAARASIPWTIAGFPVTFDALNSSDPDGDLLTYTWNFDDGADGAGDTVAHSFAREGTYTVTLTAWDDKGGTATDTIDITVLP